MDLTVCIYIYVQYVKRTDVLCTKPILGSGKLKDYVEEDTTILRFEYFQCVS